MSTTEAYDEAHRQMRHRAMVALTGGAFRERKHTTNEGGESLSSLDVHMEFIRRRAEQRVDTATEAAGLNDSEIENLFAGI